VTPPDLVSAAEDDRALKDLNNWLETQSAGDRIAWAVATLPDQHALSSSFGAQSAAALHLVTRSQRDIPVILIDTGYLFPETYRFADDLTERLGLNLKVYRPTIGVAWMEARLGRLWEQGLDGLERYNRLRKVEPMQRALTEIGARTWIAGLRRTQTAARGSIDFLELRDGRWKFHPIADWTDRDVWTYLQDSRLPNPPSWEPGMREEDTRFFGLKRECGLHF